MAALALSVFAAACGDDDDSPAGSATAAGPLAAKDLVPDLREKGYNQTLPEKVQSPATLDIVFALFQFAKPPNTQGRLEIRVYPTEEIAKGDFPAQAAGWKTPPKELFGADLGNQDSAPVAGYTDARAYAASKPDAKGNRVFTDVYRQGRVIVVSHVLSPDAAGAAELRKLLAEGIKAKAPK